MRIALPYDKGNIFEHFGHTEEFLVVDVKENKIVEKEVVKTNCGGHDKLGDFLLKRDIDVLICGGIGGGAVNFLKSAGIKLYAGNHGSVNIVLTEFLNGNIVENDKASCNHHDSNHHDCKDHCH